MKDKFKELLDKRRAEYKAYMPVFCPTLREYIHFTSDGFNHLRSKSNGKPRNETEQMYKLGLIPLIRAVIKLSPIAEYRRELAKLGRKKNHGVKIMKEIEYWGLEATVGKQNVRLKVVVRRVGLSKKVHFWSVMKV